MSAVAEAVQRQARIQCLSCDAYFACSPKRVRLIQRGESSQLCDACRALDRRQPVHVQARHRRHWTDLIKAGVIDQQWIDEVVGMIWGGRE